MSECERCGHPRSTHINGYGQEPDGLVCAMVNCNCMGGVGYLFPSKYAGRRFAGNGVVVNSKPGQN